MIIICASLYHTMPSIISECSYAIRRVVLCCLKSSCYSVLNFFGYHFSDLLPSERVHTLQILARPAQRRRGHQAQGGPGRSAEPY